MATYGDIDSPLLNKDVVSFIGIEYAFSHKNFKFTRYPFGRVDELYVP